ncbi:hypothetical protein L6452_39425 [Arctium lappa]|uniref:Uncharacterized protein n=1 Tax=Arctium lappa TaxID=4217 RepID=A0ACB8XWE5_ARCLA|nr:hypothetical protein L6452_39425 [Arctium lappa]
MATMSPPPHVGNHRPYPPLLPSTTTTTRHLPPRRHHQPLSQNINRLVFEQLHNKNLYQWNSIISSCTRNDLWFDAILVFLQFLETEHVPDCFTLPCVIKACVGISNLRFGKGIQGMGVKIGLISDVFVEGEVEQAFECLRRMQMGMGGDDGVRPDQITVLNVLKVCLYRSQLLKVRELHGYSIRHGIESDELVVNAFIAAYAKCGSSLCLAENVFKSMKDITVSSWNALISGCVQNGDPSKAIDLFVKMTSSGFDPDWYSIGSLLLACAELKLLSYGKEIHGFVLRNRIVILKLEIDRMTMNCSAAAYFKLNNSKVLH